MKLLRGYTAALSLLAIAAGIGILRYRIFSECLLEWTSPQTSSRRPQWDVQLNIEIIMVPLRDCWGHFISRNNPHSKHRDWARNEDHSTLIDSLRKRNGTVNINVAQTNRKKLLTVSPWFKNLTVLFDNGKISNNPVLDSKYRTLNDNAIHINGVKRSSRSQQYEENKMRVLILHPLYAGSHEMTLRTVGEALARAGHHVTQVRFKSSIMMSTDEAFTSNDREICSRIERAAEGEGRLEIVTLSLQNSDFRFPFIASDGTVRVPTELLWSEASDFLKVPWSAYRLIEGHCSAVLGSAQLQGVLRSRNFSVAVVDLLGNECGVALGKLLGLPLLGSWEIPVQAPSFENYGTTLPLATVPRVMTRLSDSMTFWERVHNVAHTRVSELLLVLYYGIVDYWVQLYHPDLPSTRSLLLGLDAIVVNLHVSLDYPLQLPPHVSYIGCVSCRRDRPLPPSLLRWMSAEPPSEVVLMSFGFTGFDPSAIPLNFMREVMAGLGNITQRVILQFDAAKLTKIPPNILVMKWIPLQDVLAHHLTVLHVSHCGVKAVSETVHHGVPLLCIPAFGDQGDVSSRVLHKFLGRVLDRRAVTARLVVEEITSVIADQRIKDTVAKLSRMWRAEEPAVPLFVRWLAKVERFSPLEHLHSPHQHQLNVLHYTALDASLFWLMIICATLVFLASLISSEL